MPLTYQILSVFRGVYGLESPEINLVLLYKMLEIGRHSVKTTIFNARQISHGCIHGPNIVYASILPLSLLETPDHFIYQLCHSEPIALPYRSTGHNVLLYLFC